MRLIDLQVQEKKPDEVAIEPNGMSLDLLRAVYRNPSIPLSTRIRCAVAALPHEFPRLQVTAQFQDNDLATLLDQRLKRLEKGNGKVIDGLRPQMEVKPPMPRLADRRYRRI
jgi:hypothetical protein